MTDPQQVTRLGALPISGDARRLGPENLKSYRAVSAQNTTADKLGPLRDLPGFWQGTGFNLIARPNFSGGNENGIFLELNLLRETLEFTTIGSPVPNRGSVQEDIAIFGLTYLHRVTDELTGGALHIEPGIWLNIPPTSEPESKASIARLATIPHGNAVCTVGHAESEIPDGPPHIPPANTVPFKIGGEVPPPGTKNPFPEYDLSVPNPFRTSPLPDVITQALIDDPRTMLRNSLKGQVVTKVTRLITETAPTGGVSNIPFIVKNADAPSLESVFAIQNVQDASGIEFQQLVYSQIALLNFRGMSFPHVTVGTLIKAF